MLLAGGRPATSWVHYTTSCNTQSSALEDGQNNFPKHVELTGIINMPLVLHLIGCLYYLFQWCTVKQISGNEIYLLIKYIKSVLWRVAKRLSYIEEARCLKVNLHEQRCENQKSRNICPYFLVNCINLRISCILACLVFCNPTYTYFHFWESRSLHVIIHAAAALRSH